MSHEIRTPMNAVIGMAELSLREDISPTVHEYVSTIKQASLNLLDIINDILDLSKIENGSIDIAHEEYMLSSLINDVVHIIKTKAHESRLRFVVNVDNHIPNALCGDVKRIRQIMLNLLGNAVKYTEKGFVSLTVYGRMMDDGFVMLKIEVADSGIGIHQQDIGRLFDKFARFDEDRNKHVEGTGLGLAITKNLIETMGGKIEVRSTRGEGSAFTVRLPQKVRDGKKLAVAENMKDKRVLIFERREICIYSIIQTMESLGVNYKLVSHSVDFFQELRSNLYSHIFVAAVLYERAKIEHGELATDAKVMLIAEFGEIVRERNVSVLTTPIFSIPVADFLNGVFDFAAAGRVNREPVSYVLPGVKILSVDDVNTNLRVLEGLLKPYEAQVVSCKNGAAAVEAAMNADFDLIFMDHMMPGMDGVETAKRIRALEHFEARPDKPAVIALSANAVLGSREMFLQNGFDDFLTKPIDTVKLEAILNKWIPAEKWRTKAGGNETERAAADEPAAAETDDGIYIEGVNAARGIARTGGSAENYKTTLAVFHKDGQEKYREIRMCLDMGDIPLYTIYVHALKSAASNIGADNLARTAAALEAAGRDNDAALISAGSERLLEDLEELLGQINLFLVNTNDNGEIVAVDAGYIKGELKRLGDAINAFDSPIIKACTDNLRKYVHSAGFGAAIDDILQYVLIGDDERALSAIGAIT